MQHLPSARAELRDMITEFSTSRDMSKVLEMFTKFLEVLDDHHEWFVELCDAAKALEARQEWLLERSSPQLKEDFEKAFPLKLGQRETD